MKKYENLDLFLKKLTALSKKHNIFIDYSMSSRKFFYDNSSELSSCMEMRVSGSIDLKDKDGNIIAEKLFFYGDDSYHVEERECVESSRQQRSCFFCHEEH